MSKYINAEDLINELSAGCMPKTNLNLVFAVVYF